MKKFNYNNTRMLKRILFIVFCALFYLLGSAIFPEFSRADDYTISSNTTSTNGGNTIDGSDSLLLESGISIGVSGTDASGITFTGDGNTLNVLGSVTTNGLRGYGIYLNASDNNTITQSGKITTQGRTSRLYMIKNSDSNDITQSGDLESTGDRWSHCYYLDNADSNTITQTGNCTTAGSYARSHGYFFDDVSGDNSGSDGNTIIQIGNITLTENTNKAYYCEKGDNNSITQSGTITTSGTDGHGYHFKQNCDNNTITLSGTISVSGTNAKAIKVESGNDANTLVLSEEPTITGNVDLGSEDFTISLSCDLKKDLTVTLDNKTGMTVTNNLCGNDTYEILDSSLAADADNSETNGYLKIYGEDLEIAQNNPKYRSENVLTKLRGLFTAANYIHWQAPEEKFFKIFHSTQKREGIYTGDMSGVVGQLNPFVWGSLRSNVFLGYTRQGGDFDNGEFLGGDNFALGLKNVYENNAFTASFTPMIGMADLKITDFDTDTKTSITTNLLSEFAGINGKLGREIKLSEEGSLDLNIQSTLGLQRFPEYLAIFSDGDLTVDEAVEQILGVGFEVKYKDELKKGFIIQPYVGFNINNNFNNKIKITADGENKNVSPAYTTTSGYYAGVSFTKEKDGLDFDLDLMYGNEDGLINQIAAVSLTKSFGKAKKETIKLEPVPDLPKVDESLTTQDYTKDLNKLETQNEKLKLLAEKVLQESEISKHLIKELVTEVEKLKFTNQIFKDKILKLENENVELPQTIEKGDQKPKVDKFKLLLFLATIYGLAGGLTLLIISFMNIIRLKLVNQI